MKKLFFAGALALFGAMNAQEFKPTTGDVTVDFGLSGGINNTTVGFAEGGVFKARYFTADNFAYRGLLNLTTGTTNDKATDVETSGFKLNLGFGVEKHFTGTERLSPYVGADVLVGFDSKKVETGTTTTKGPNTFNFGVRGVFGADYYFAKRVFLGVEAGLGLGFESTGKTKVNGTTLSKGSNSFNIAPELITGVRLGYAF